MLKKIINLASHTSSYVLQFREWNRQRNKKSRQKKRLSVEKSYKARLAVLAIMKNEEFGLREWINHYLDQEVGKIFLIDNGSTDRSKEIAESFVDTGRVEYVFLPKKWSQREHYWEVILRLKIREEFEWLLTADIDEFWFCRDGSKIPAKLSDFTGIDVVYTNWSVFGSSELELQPESVRGSFVMRKPDLGPHIFTKWICRTSALKEFSQLEIHKIKGICSSRTVSENEYFQLNHYQIQSREFYGNVKMRRGDAVNSIFDNARNWDYFEKLDQDCTVEDNNLSQIVAGKS
jgi:glycosyltransferase involved in cell wall biosynthesis|tara:strand:+ start:585 stop:1454 length:870 start_codon:yes stop_codon:yes gene_type:complete